MERAPGTRSAAPKSRGAQTSKGIRRQGVVLIRRNSLQRKSLCPVVLCPFLCSSEKNTRCALRIARITAHAPPARHDASSLRRSMKLRMSANLTSFSCRTGAAFGWHYLSNITCLIRPHLFYVCFVVSRVTITYYTIRHL